jgi:hypothetical protein
MTRGAQCPNGVLEHDRSAKSMNPRQFDPNDLSDLINRNLLINSESVKKSRSKSKQMKLIGNRSYFLKYVLIDCLKRVLFKRAHGPKMYDYGMVRLVGLFINLWQWTPKTNPQV